MKREFDDFVFFNEEEDYVDISGGEDEKETKKSSSGKKHNEDGGIGKKKKIIIISSVAAVVVAAAIGVTGFCLFNNNGLFAGSTADEPEFTFADGTVVSGISISGKTMSEAKTLLESREASFVTPVSISVDANGEITTLTEKDFEYTYDIDSVLATIKSDEESSDEQSATETKTYTITATYTAESVESVTAEIEEATNSDAVNATVSKFNPYSDNRFEYTDAQIGYKLDSENLSEQISAALESGESEVSIEADVEEVEAEIQTEDLKNNIKKLASYQTVSYNTANGTSNMKISLEACNGSVIEPGATWSFNECTGDSNLESNGYKSAHVISNGELVDGIGGGICQSSSTIYNAAIRANMDIEERTNHKWASSYVPTGLDATIDYPNLDLKLSNPTKYQMFMECKLVDSTLYVSIWGVQEDTSYDEIRTHNELVSQDSSSYTVKAWRVYYKDGEEVDRESLGSSTYDNDNGYVFIDADSDTNGDNDSDDGDDDDGSEKTDTQSSSSSSSSKTSSSSKPSSTASQSSHSSSSSSKTSSSATSATQTTKVTEPTTAKTTEASSKTEATTVPATTESSEVSEE